MARGRGVQGAHPQHHPEDAEGVAETALGAVAGRLGPSLDGDYAGYIWCRETLGNDGCGGKNGMVALAMEARLSTLRFTGLAGRHHRRYDHLGPDRNTNRHF